MGIVKLYPATMTWKVIRKIIAKIFFKRYINTVHIMDKEDEQVWHLLHLRGTQLHC